MPVAGDLSRLPFADGLSSFERSLARAIGYRAACMPGTQMLRQHMGSCATGARICHGESLFATWSPNEQHSAIVLRLMRTRQNDPSLMALQFGSETDKQALPRIQTHEVSFC